MLWKYFGVVAAVALALSGCSSSADEDAQSPTEDKAVEQSTVDSSQNEETTKEDQGPAIPELLDTTHKRALAAEDLHESVANGRLSIDGRGLHIELPDTFTREVDVHPAHIAMWSSKDKQQSAVLSVAGTAGVVPDGQTYLADLQKSELAAGYDIQYVGDVEFGEASVKEFHLTGAGRVLELFAFEYNGISYELTLRATDQANLDNLHGFALATVITKEAELETTGDTNNTGDQNVNNNETGDNNTDEDTTNNE